jgi:hypothetical protein
MFGTGDTFGLQNDDGTTTYALVYDITRTEFECSYNTLCVSHRSDQFFYFCDGTFISARSYEIGESFQKNTRPLTDKEVLGLKNAIKYWIKARETQTEKVKSALPL